MQQSTAAVQLVVSALFIIVAPTESAVAHPDTDDVALHAHGDSAVRTELLRGGTRVAQADAGRAPAGVDPMTGQGALRFRVLYTSTHLPDAARKVLPQAHGGFAVDRRDGQGETYFALKGAGILRISTDMSSIRLLDSPPRIRDANMHNTTFWAGPDGTPYLTFPANDSGRVLTASLDGGLVHTLQTPGPGIRFSDQRVTDYFDRKETFVPTDVEYLDNHFYITTGYSELDFVLTARIAQFRPMRIRWNALSFGGRGSDAGQFGTGHGITVSPGGESLNIADRPRAEIDRFNPEGRYLSTLSLPEGSYPCDIDFEDGLAVVPCLHGPDREKGAPIYLLENGKVVSTLMIKEDLKLDGFQHVHNAVLRELEGRFYIIAQAWNPGDFAILVQVEND